MAKLAKLLDAKEPLFSLAIRDLEKITGQKARDVELLSDMLSSAQDRMRKLRLDPTDTTGPELYKALENRVAADNERVTKLIGGKDPDNLKALTPLMVKAASKSSVSKKCWVLRRSVAKELIRAMPPANMMKHLGYRTVDSLLKREPFDEMYTALRFSEGADWLRRYNERFKSVRPSDFEQRDIQIIEMDHDKWIDLAADFIAKRPHNVTHTKELGVIVVIPTKKTKIRGATLKVLPLIFHYINEIRLYSAYFRLKSTSKHFGAEVVDTLIADPGKAAAVAGQHIHWRVIQRYYAKVTDEKHPEQFEPHVHPEDLHWRKAEESLYELDPEMEFWRELDFVAMDYPAGPVSFNLLDVSFGYSNEISYDHRYMYHFREALWNEIFIRYMGEKVLEEQVLRQLDNDMIAPELAWEGAK